MWKQFPVEGEHFRLIVDGETLNADSVAKALHSKAEYVHCGPQTLYRISCADDFGYFLIFDLHLLKGGIAKVFGAVETMAAREPISIGTFSCQ